MKDKLWFFGAFRRAHYDKPIANTFACPPAPTIPALVQVAPATRAPCEQGVSDEKMDNPVVRLTWQISPRNKFAAYMDRAHAPARPRDGQPDRSEHRVGGLAHADVRHRLGQVDVDGVVEAAARNRLLVQPRALRQRLSAGHRPAAARRGWYAGARKSDNSTGLLWNASSAQLGNYPGPDTTCTAALSYVTGSHNIKFGVDRPVGPLPPLEHRQRRSLSDLQERRAAARHRAEHAARGAGEPRRQRRRSMPRTVERRQADGQLRAALRLPTAAHRRRAGADRPLRELGRLQRHRPADVEATFRRDCRWSTTCRATARRRFASASTSS